MRKLVGTYQEATRAHAFEIVKHQTLNPLVFNDTSLDAVRTCALADKGASTVLPSPSAVSRARTVINEGAAGESGLEFSNINEKRDTWNLSNLDQLRRRLLARMTIPDDSELADWPLRSALAFDGAPITKHKSILSVVAKPTDPRLMEKVRTTPQSVLGDLVIEVAGSFSEEDGGIVIEIVGGIFDELSELGKASVDVEGRGRVCFEIVSTAEF